MNFILVVIYIVSVEQRILALADSWWRKASKNNDDIIIFTYHLQTNTNAKAPLNNTKGTLKCQINGGRVLIIGWVGNLPDI